METHNKSLLLKQFSQYLEAVEIESETEETDLYSLYTEMAALRNEVKTEARQFKTALEHFKSGFDVLEQANTKLSKELDTVRLQQEEQHRELTRNFLLDILDIYDRLAAGKNIVENYHPVSSFFNSSHKHDTTFINSMLEGQAMSIRRVLQLMEKHQVVPMQVLSRPLDPHTMIAVEISNNPDLDDGIVIEELRKGFTIQGEVLRLAEVKVNKQETK